MIHSFLMIGQSNMAGRGHLDEVPPIRDEKIKMLRNGRWQVMAEPINYDRPFAGIGLAASFAAGFRARHPQEEVGLIPCADGGSSLEEWLPGSALFDSAVLNAKLAQRISSIDGILWHQGETDCVLERALRYKERFSEIISAFRRELELPSQPLLIGGLGEFLTDCRLHDYFVNAPIVDQALRDFAAANEHCYYVTAKGLKANPDQLHFNAASLRIFGLRYLEAYERLEHITEPLEQEDAMIIGNDAGQRPEELLLMLKKQLEEEKISRADYNKSVDNLISQM